jgi:hypothetical protein
VHFVGKNLFEKHKEIVSEYELTLTEEQYRKVIALMIDHANLPYAILQLFGMAFVCFMKKLGVTIHKNPLSSGKEEQVCSEAIAILCEAMGIKIDLDKDLVGPNYLRSVIGSVTHDY